MSHRNLQLRRFYSAQEFFKRPHWSERALVEKGGNLALRLLAINQVLVAQGRSLLTDDVKDALLILVETTVPTEGANATKEDHHGDKAKRHKQRVRRTPDNARRMGVDVPGDGRDDHRRAEVDGA